MDGPAQDLKTQHVLPLPVNRAADGQELSIGPGFTVWLTGLPCSGKSTLALAIAEELLRARRPTEVLDGDFVRRTLSPELGFDRQSRDENIRRIAFLSQLLNRNGACVVVAAVSPYRAARLEARAQINRFVEVFVDCPLRVCEARDVKGMYERARAGSLGQFTGVSDPYEAPLNPELHLHTADEPVRDSTRRILQFLAANGYVERHLAGLSPAAVAERLGLLRIHT